MQRAFCVSNVWLAYWERYSDNVGGIMAEENKEIVIIDETTIKSKIHYIRNQKVMLDFELAEIYGYETKVFNRQVKRNIEKFDDDFMFQLTDEEVYELSRCHFGTLNDGQVSELSRSHFATLKKGQGRGSNIKYKPYVFRRTGNLYAYDCIKGRTGS